MSDKKIFPKYDRIGIHLEILKEVIGAAKKLKGRLHYLDCDTLDRLKRELRNYSERTGKWKS